MTLPAQVELKPRSLPPLSGGLLAAYIIAWVLLGATVAGVIGVSVLQPSEPAGILVLRTVKAAVLVGVAAILLRRRRRDPVAALLSLAFLLWAITSSFDFAGPSASLPILLDRLRFLLFAVALLLFPDAQWRPGWTRHVAATSFAVFLLGVGESVGLLPTRLFLPLAIVCVLAAIAALISRFRMAQNETERQQLKWVALGLVSGVALILSARAGAALMSAAGIAPVLLEALFQLGIILVALGFLVSLLRYRLFDAEAAITRSAAYAGLTVALVATFSGSEALIEMLGQRYLGMGVGDVSAAMAAAIAAVLLSPLHERISAWAEQRFERDLALLKRQLPELLAELSGSSTRKLAAAVLPRIQVAIHAKQAALIVDDTVVATLGVEPPQVMNSSRRALGEVIGRQFHHVPEDPLFPTRMVMRCAFGQVRGCLLLGPRPDGSQHGKHELAALAAIAPALRQALFTSKSRDDERQRDQRLFRAIRRKVDDLSLRLDTIVCDSTDSGAMSRFVEAGTGQPKS